MTVYLLPVEPVFPPVSEAEPNGLLAVGGDLSAERLINAYASGIFPWFEEESEIYWFSPDPRLVLFPEKYKRSNSLQRIIKSGRYTVRFDTCFESVIRGCAEASRPDQNGTWISNLFIEGYIALHHLGFAHSVETYRENQLVGGLYGVSLGKAFFGESMFFTESNASKVAFSALVERMCDWNFLFIDCQVETKHLLSLGAEQVSRSSYQAWLKKALAFATRKGAWDISKK